MVSCAELGNAGSNSAGVTPGKLSELRMVLLIFSLGCWCYKSLGGKVVVSLFLQMESRETCLVAVNLEGKISSVFKD